MPLTNLKFRHSRQHHAAPRDFATWNTDFFGHAHGSLHRGERGDHQSSLNGAVGQHNRLFRQYFHLADPIRVFRNVGEVVVASTRSSQWVARGEQNTEKEGNEE